MSSAPPTAPLSLRSNIRDFRSGGFSVIPRGAGPIPAPLLVQALLFRSFVKFLLPVIAGGLSLIGLLMIFLSPLPSSSDERNNGRLSTPTEKRPPRSRSVTIGVDAHPQNTRKVIAPIVENHYRSVRQASLQTSVGTSATEVAPNNYNPSISETPRLPSLQEAGHPMAGSLTPLYGSDLITPREEQLIFEIVATFTESVRSSPSTDPDDPNYFNRWRDAVNVADERLRTAIGWDRYNKLSLLAIRNATNK